MTLKFGMSKKNNLINRYEENLVNNYKKNIELEEISARTVRYAKPTDFGNLETGTSKIYYETYDFIDFNAGDDYNITGSNIHVPRDWEGQTIKAIIYFYNFYLGTGNTPIILYIWNGRNGQAISQSCNQTDTLISDGAEKFSSVEFNIGNTYKEDDIMSISIMRNGSNPADTNTEKISFAIIIFKKE